MIGLVAVLAIGATALAVASGDRGNSPRPAYATVTVDLGHAQRTAARQRGGLGSTTKKPRVVYLQGGTPVTINPADQAAGGVGPDIDVKLTGCSKVIDGGVVPSRLDVFVQGNYVKSPGEYHVLIGIDPDRLADRTPFTITSNLTCLKGVK
jgi:hypothetical protein